MKILVFDDDKILYQNGIGFDDKMPKSKKEAVKLIEVFKKQIFNIEKSVDEFDKKSESKVVRLALCASDIKFVKSSDFKNGLANVEMELGDKFLIDERISNGSLNFISTSNIYYEDKIIVSRGGKIPYYKTLQTSEDDDAKVKNSIIKVVLDLRPAGVYGADFDTEKLNNGIGDFGTDFNIRLHSEFHYPTM